MSITVSSCAAWCSARRRSSVARCTTVRGFIATAARTLISILKSDGMSEGELTRFEAAILQAVGEAYGRVAGTPPHTPSSATRIEGWSDERRAAGARL